MKVLITGIAGFLGSHLADAWLAKGADVVGIDDLSGGDPENIPEGVNWLRFPCEGIVHGEAEERTIFSDIDCVYHCAALAHEGLSVFSPSRITRSIFGASVAVFSAAIEAGVPKIVNCSSMARYGRIPIAHFSEWYEPVPVDPYGIAKVASENVLKALLSVHHKTKGVTAVPHNIVGPRQKYDDPYRNVAAIMVNRALQGKQPIIYGNGDQKRCFSDIRDVIPIMVRLADCEGIYNVGPDSGEVTINELASKICDLCDLEFDPIYVPARPLEVKAPLCSSEKIRRQFDFAQQHSLSETLEALVAYIREKGPKPFKYHLPIEISEGCPETWKEQLI